MAVSVKKSCLLLCERNETYQRAPSSFLRQFNATIAARDDGDLRHID